MCAAIGFEECFGDNAQLWTWLVPRRYQAYEHIWSRRMLFYVVDFGSCVQLGEKLFEGWAAALAAVQEPLLLRILVVHLTDAA